MRTPRSPLVVNCETDPFDVYVGRGTPWGNPFRQGRCETRTQLVGRYRRWLLSQPDLAERVRTELCGKRLGRHCRPKHPCHGDVLAEVANG